MRPHEALGQVPPARLYTASPRPFPARLEEPCYDATHQVRRVRDNGEIKWRGELVFVSAALRHEPVGLAEGAPPVTNCLPEGLNAGIGPVIRRS